MLQQYLQNSVTGWLKLKRHLTPHFKKEYNIIQLVTIFCDRLHVTIPIKEGRKKINKRRTK